MSQYQSWTTITKISSTITGKKQKKEAITGVAEQNTDDTHNNTLPAIENQDKASTGVESKQSTENTHDNIQQLIPEEENNPDEYVTIGDINIMSEMNASNRETEMEQTENEETDIRSNERYNL